jgi:hypothetical protein
MYMFGGLLKSTSLAALVATAGLAVSGISAQAADLGGNCCADLEERIAELEATTARKGNRKVSLTVSGQVNEALIVWDDGVERNAYVSTNEASRSRFRFLGSAKIDAALTAGYLLEIGVRGNRSDRVDQNTDSVGAPDKGLDVRHSAWWLQHKDLGKIWLGQTSQSADSITEIDLASTGHFNLQEFDYLGNFKVRNQGTGNLGTIAYRNLANSLGNPGEGTRFNVIKYETPTLAGFIGSASWGEDKVWDVALRYAGEFSGVKLAAGIAYAQWTDGNSDGAAAATLGDRGCTRVNTANANGRDVSCNELGLSASIMHVPTGLFFTGAYGYRDDNNKRLVAGLANTSDRDDFYKLEGGIEQKFNSLGKTTLFGAYYVGSYGAPTNNGAATTGTAAGRAVSGLGQAGGNLINSTEMTTWSVGFNQNIEAAAMDLYVIYKHFDFDIKDTVGNKILVNDFQLVTAGARIQF